MFPIPRFTVVRTALSLALALSVPGLGVHDLVAQVPAGVSDSLVFHLRADDVLDNGGSPSPASGDSVATWNDVSGTASEHDFTDAVDLGAFGDLTPPLFAAGNGPSAINYRPVVDFSALDMGLSTPDAPALNSVSHDLKSFSVVFRTSTDAGTGTEVVHEEGGRVNGLNVYTRHGVLGLGAWAQGAPSGWSLWGETAVGSQEVHLASLVFDGISQYLAVTGLNYHTGQRIGRMASCAVFRTTHGASNNWALLDFDRSEYFNVNVSDAGRVEMALGDGSISDDGATTRAKTAGRWTPAPRPPASTCSNCGAGTVRSCSGNPWPSRPAEPAQRADSRSFSAKRWRNLSILGRMT
jgi:hypothetical protein